jgi:hypothetical protein
MNIAVVGSYQESLNNLSRPIAFEIFEEACKAIGKALGEGNHRLMVAHRINPHQDRKQSAEAIALEGFLETRNGDHFVEVPHHDGDPQLKAHTEAVYRSDAVILIGGKEGTYAAGLTALLRRKMIITIPAFGGSAKDLCEIREIDRTVIDQLRNLDTSREEWLHILVGAINSEINSYPRILIVHGRGDNGKELRDKIIGTGKCQGKLLGIGEPAIMELTGKGAVSVPEVFEDFASKVSATIAIVTADDVGGYARLDGKGSNVDGIGEELGRELPATELRLTPRARENVWVEVGWFWGRLDRRRIFLWLKDNVPLPSDLQGAAWVKGNLDKAWPEIHEFICNLRQSTYEC